MTTSPYVSHYAVDTAYAIGLDHGEQGLTPEPVTALIGAAKAIYGGLDAGTMIKVVEAYATGMEDAKTDTYEENIANRQAQAIESYRQERVHWENIKSAKNRD